ncbi:hypothetical protein DRQ20_05800 [bacterium]|nr:MAG: hypothetical protein DRQ20_05800 [bacterium]
MVDELNKKMIEDVKKKGFMKEKEIEKAFLKTPRHFFVPTLYEYEEGKWIKYELDYENPQKEILEKIYRDMPLVVAMKEDEVLSTTSMPTVMTMMIEEGKVKKKDRVMELGTGTGYNACVLANLTGERVVSIEIIPEVAELARENIKRAGMEERVKVITGDGGFGYPEDAPYTVFIITSASSDITRYWVDQLEEGGRIVLPLVTRGMETIVSLEKKGEILEGKPSYYVRFLQLRGPSSIISNYGISEKQMRPLSRIIKKFAKEDEEIKEMVDKLERRERMDFFFFLALTEEYATALHSEEFEWGYGIWDRTPGKGGFVFYLQDRVVVWGDEGVKKKFMNAYKGWERAGKPALKDYTLTVYPVGKEPSQRRGRWVVKRRQMTTVFEKKGG